MFSHTCWVSQSPHGAPTVRQIALTSPVSTLPTLIDPPVEGLVEPVSLMPVLQKQLHILSSL